MPTSNAKKQGILQQASDWTLQADLDKKLQFPDIVLTSLRPDIVVQSTATQCLFIVELTVPWEERCQSPYELKKAKYNDLHTLFKERGQQTQLFPLEVGCRGFPAQSVQTTLSSLCIVGRQRKAAVKAYGQAAERASSWLWLNRRTGSYPMRGSDHMITTDPPL